MRLHLDADVTHLSHFSRNRTEGGVQGMQPHHCVAEVAATGEQYAVTNARIAFSRDHRNESAERIADDRVRFGRKLPRHGDQVVGAFVYPSAEVAES